MKLRMIAAAACMAPLLVGAVAGCTSSNVGNGSANGSVSTSATESSTPAPPTSSTPAPPTSSAPSSSAATISAFVGKWNGHDRYMTIGASGTGMESVSDGCCTPQIDLTFHVSAGASDSNASVVVTAVTIHPDYPSSAPQPKVGDTGSLTLANGVVTDSLTNITYCDAAETAKSTCGA